MSRYKQHHLVEKKRLWGVRDLPFKMGMADTRVYFRVLKAAPVGSDYTGMWVIPLHYGIPKGRDYEKADRRTTTTH